METIEVAVGPVDDTGGLMTHTFLIYTTASGERYVFHGFPERDEVGNWGALHAAVQPATNKAETYNFDRIEQAEKGKLIKTVIRGEDLSHLWDIVRRLEWDINSAKLEYVYEATSNTATRFALDLMGFPDVDLTFFPGRPWQPPDPLDLFGANPGKWAFGEQSYVGLKHPFPFPRTLNELVDLRASAFVADALAMPAGQRRPMQQWVLDERQELLNRLARGEAIDLSQAIPNLAPDYVLPGTVEELLSSDLLRGAVELPLYKRTEQERNAVELFQQLDGDSLSGLLGTDLFENIMSDFGTERATALDQLVIDKLIQGRPDMLIEAMSPDRLYEIENKLPGTRLPHEQAFVDAYRAAQRQHILDLQAQRDGLGMVSGLGVSGSGGAYPDALATSAKTGALTPAMRLAALRTMAPSDSVLADLRQAYYDMGIRDVGEVRPGHGNGRSAFQGLAARTPGSADPLAARLAQYAAGVTDPGEAAAGGTHGAAGWPRPDAGGSVGALDYAYWLNKGFDPKTAAKYAQRYAEVEGLPAPGTLDWQIAQAKKASKRYAADQAALAPHAQLGITGNQPLPSAAAALAAQAGGPEVGGAAQKIDIPYWIKKMGLDPKTAAKYAKRYAGVEDLPAPGTLDWLSLSVGTIRATA